MEAAGGRALRSLRLSEALPTSASYPQRESHGPIVQPQSGNAAEVAAVARHDYEIVRAGHCRDLQVLGADAQAQRQELLELVLGSLIERHQGELVKKPDTCQEQRVAANPGRTIPGTGDGGQSATEVLLHGDG